MGRLVAIASHRLDTNLVIPDDAMYSQKFHSSKEAKDPWLQINIQLQKNDIDVA